MFQADMGYYYLNVLAWGGPPAIRKPAFEGGMQGWGLFFLAQVFTLEELLRSSLLP
jgi:hypothetical protein